MATKKSPAETPASPTRPSKLQYALNCASRGWAVIPLYWVEHGDCACSATKCASPGKHPLTVSGVKGATTDKTWIRTWWKKYPEANIGIATGAVSGIVVLDVDPRHGGDQSLGELEETHGALPLGPRVLTGGGGQHLYFSTDGAELKNAVGLRPGLDVRGDGGYVVGPGSDHISGKRYLWQKGMTPDKAPLPSVPEYLRTLASPTPSASQAPPNSDAIPERQRNSTLTSLAGTMRHRGMHQASIEAALLQENRHRCKPPLAEDEVSRIATSVGRYLPGNVPSGTARTERTLVFHTGAEIANAVAEQVPWVAEPYVAVSAITDISGKVKLAGKTTFALDLVRNVIQGTDFLGHKTVQSPVVYLTEQGKVTFREAMKRAGLLEQTDLHVLFRSEAFGVSWHEVAAEAVRKCEATASKLLVTDTLPQFAGLIRDAENDSGAALAAIEPLQMAAARGIGILTISHNRKGGGALGDARRGSSAFAGAVDVLCGLQRPEGNGPRNRRVLSAVSRFDGIPEELLIELREDGIFHSLGEPGKAAKEQAEHEVLIALPMSKADALDIHALGKKTNIQRSQLQRVLEVLLKNDLARSTGKGVRKDPIRYFAAREDDDE